MVTRLKMRLGDLLVQEGVIDDSQLKQALDGQRKTGRKLGQTLIDINVLKESELLGFLSRQLNVPLVNLTDISIKPDLVKRLPEVIARRFRALVIEEHPAHYVVAVSDPADINALDGIADILDKPAELAIAPESQLLRAFDLNYRRTDEIASFAKELASEYQETEEFDFTAGIGEEDNTVAKLLQSVFEDALQLKASDIHIEPEENALRIRQRVDGVLQENVIEQSNIAAALVLRIKLMAGLDISEKRLPQDGRTHLRLKGHTIDIRVSTMPVQHGESVVLRLLDQSAGLLELEQTGMPEDMLVRFRRLLARPNGMILVTGPTGSGKTTTLYGALSELNQASNKIITAEDPVEYRLPRVNQVQVNHKIGLDFSNILRTTLRQDPDIIMVGEMRDGETVEIGLRGALTGHLVLSTLHTNDAISSTIRLLDMGAPGYLVASSLRGIIAQRLVRRICPQCSAPYQPTVEEQFWLDSIPYNHDNQHDQYQQGVGCQSCHFTGYRGRIGVFELLEVTESMMNALKQSDTVGFAEIVKQRASYQPLTSAALNYAIAGKTSVQEVLKLVEMVADDTEVGH